MRHSLLEKKVSELMSLDKVRTEFERQHEGRRLTRFGHHTTYSDGPIAALWSQHLRTILWMAGNVNE